MFEDQNLLNINASDKYRYCLKILDILFTKEVIKVGAVEPTGAGVFVALNADKIKILKGFLLLFLIAYFNLNIFLNRCFSNKVQNKKCNI
jgi:hypothetical protein